MGWGRFAPSTTGRAHLGTLLAALLAWLDARRLGLPVLLRLENLDVARSREAYLTGLQDDLAWLGLDWDAVEVQTNAAARHAAALDALAAQGALYRCTCSRQRLRALGRPAPGGGWAYDNRCRPAVLGPADWRRVADALRAQLPAGHVSVWDEGGLDLGQDVTAVVGDPIVRRRDGAVAYQLAVVVDDAAREVARVVRGRDLAASTATQVALQTLLGLPRPTYRHHLLFLARQGAKLAKAQASTSGLALRSSLTGDTMCGRLAAACGLIDVATPIQPQALVKNFSWARVRQEDRFFSAT